MWVRFEEHPKAIAGQIAQLPPAEWKTLEGGEEIAAWKKLRDHYLAMGPVVIRAVGLPSEIGGMIETHRPSSWIAHAMNGIVLMALPDASHISFARSTTLWSGVVNGSSLPGRGGPCEVANPVLDGFMGARARGDADAALALLDENGRRAYSGGRTLVWRGEPRLHRYYTILEQPSGAGCRYVVRLVLPRGNLDVSGRPLVHGSTAGQPRLLGKGPEVVLVEVTDPTHLRISFDSDLDPAVSQAIQVQGPGGRLAAQGSYSDRIVTLTLSAPLDPSGTYQLLVPARGVKDVGGRQPQADYSLEFSGPD